MNKHILLVMKWFDDKDSVSQEKLEENWRETWGTYVDAEAAYGVAAARAAADAAYWATFPCSDNAAYWVDEYFKETSEDKNEYLKELSK